MSNRHDVDHGARAGAAGVANVGPSAGVHDVGLAVAVNAASWIDVPVG